MISVICVYNNEKTFRDTLYKSLQIQTVPHDLIAIDNTEGRFASAAQALNYGASKARHDSAFFLFVHQDIALCSPFFLADAEKMLDQLPNLGIAGVAGNVDGDDRFFSNITHGSPPHNAGRKIEKPVRAMTVDECLVFVPRHVFIQQQFDETVCDGWHLYVVEYCLRLIDAGFGPYILPASIHHGSVGMLNVDYFRKLKKVLHKHHSNYRKIYTTCGCWDTRTPVEVQMMYHFLRRGYCIATDKLFSSGVIPAWVLAKKAQLKYWRDWIIR